MFRCVEVDATDADLRRTVHFAWRGLVKHLGLLPADGEAKVLGYIKEAVNNVLQGFLHMCEMGTVIRNGSVMRSSMDFIHVRRHQRLNRLLSVWKHM